ncbi:MAG TPA: hypothetical protein DIT64_07185 [Verrucomicrobiales bacterium]|nr:hypothetical protein [Verrucomicrobiales bacterium]
MKEAAYDYLKLLEEHDHTRRCEYPPSFDLKAAEERFAHLAEELIAAYPGSTFETGAAIQDASFHGQIFLAFEGLTILIRASNFGRFITFFDEEEHMLLPDETRCWLLELFIKHGYRFIPPEVLSMPYTGECKGVSGFRDWGYRYFEWI